jgi:hypothetical protein
LNLGKGYYEDGYRLARMKMTNIIHLCRLVMLVALTLVASRPSTAATNSGYVVDHGVAVYYAIVPAEVIRGHSKQHSEVAMHGGVPDRPHVHHVMVAVFHASTLERIVDASVTATVGEIGLAVDQRQLEPFTVAGALTYGNYFDLLPSTDYRVRIDVSVPGSENQARIEFEYKHE